MVTRSSNEPPPATARVLKDLASTNKNSTTAAHHDLEMETAMADIKMDGNPIHTSGRLPALGSTPPDPVLVKADLSEVKLSTYRGRKLLNVFPSVETKVCASSVRTFIKRAAGKSGVTVL